MRHEPRWPAWPDRDRLILGKGRAAAALYCACTQAGYLNEASLAALSRRENPLPGVRDRGTLPILGASLAWAGDGLSLGLGAALAGRTERRGYRVYVLLDAEECREAHVWKAATVAAHHSADNLCTIVDFEQSRPGGRSGQALRG